MRRTSRSAGIAVLSVLALTVSACGGGGSDSNGGGGNANPDDYQAPTVVGDAPDELTVYGCNPQNPLVPQNTAETCGGDPQDLTVAKLVHYDVDDAAPEFDIAESIETEDNQTFTVKLKPDYKFHDGTEVKAKNFVDAWNYTAYGPERPGRSLLLRADRGLRRPPVPGRVRGQPDAVARAPAERPRQMTGLKVVDDTTFTIKTTEQVSNLPVRLGYTAFAPLPDSFFTDPKAFEKKPIGAGPFKVESSSATPIRRAHQVRRLLGRARRPA